MPGIVVFPVAEWKKWHRKAATDTLADVTLLPASYTDVLPMSTTTLDPLLIDAAADAAA